MELDNLKQLWQNQPASPTNLDKLSEMVKRQSGSSLGKMRRTLRYELLLVILSLGAVILYFILTRNEKTMDVVWLYLALILVYLLYFFRKDRLLKTMQCVTCEVRSNLNLHLGKLEKLLKIYLWAGTLLFPITILYLGFLFYIHIPSFIPKNIFFHSPAYAWWQTALAWIGLAAIFTLPGYWLNKWYVHWLYGKHVERLKKLTAEMEEEGINL